MCQQGMERKGVWKPSSFSFVFILCAKGVGGITTCEQFLFQGISLL
jgi:hypothetical protein